MAGVFLQAACPSSHPIREHLQRNVKEPRYLPTSLRPSNALMTTTLQFSRQETSRAVVCLPAAPRIQLSISVRNPRQHNALTLVHANCQSAAILTSPYLPSRLQSRGDQLQQCQSTDGNTTTTTTVLRPFFRDHPGEPVPEENFWTVWCKGRLTEADTATIRLGATPSGLTLPTSTILPFFTGQLPFLPPNQQCQSTEGNTYAQILDSTRYRAYLRHATVKIPQCH